MLSFLEYFEEASKRRDLFYHITKGENLKSILSQGLLPNKLANFKDDYSDITHSKKAYFGTYMARNLKELAMTVGDWGVIDFNDIGLIVIESRGFTQLFMDEDNLINSLPYIQRDHIPSKLDRFVENNFQNFPEINQFIITFLNNIKSKFYIDKYKKEVLKNILIQNAPVLFFRGVDRSRKANPVNIRKFLQYYNKQDTESWFRETFDKMTKLKLQFKNVATGFDLDSVRITKPIGFSGNPKIVGIYKFRKNTNNSKTLYSRLDKEEEDNIISIVEDVVEYYTDEE
jgi:hypothetical protein